MTNEVKCKHYDPINGWCEKLSDFGYPKHIECCPKSPCEYAEPIEQPMSDEDIKKDLMRCANKDVSFCKTCKHRNYGSECCIQLMKDALDLINRLKAENKTLAEYNDNLLSANAALSCTLLDEVKKAKTEAIKEFSERLKRNISLYGFSRQLTAAVHIDNLVKEMTEGEA